MLAGLLYVSTLLAFAREFIVWNADDQIRCFSWYMGLDELSGNGITVKVLYFLTDRTMTPYNEPLRRVRKSRIFLFVAVQLIAFGATFVITQTIGTPSFTLRRVNVETYPIGPLFFFVLLRQPRLGFPS